MTDNQEGSLQRWINKVSKTISGYCFTCHDSTFFQIFGHTPDYKPGEVAELYIGKYISDGHPVVICDLCNRRVRYVIVDDHWMEKEEPETPVPPVVTGESAEDY